MNFQKLKVSACGHELGSSLLFGSRVGFSGTPSNLLPMDLGECQYEPGSDGRIVHVLSSHRVCKVTPKTSWTAQSLLKDIAKQTRIQAPVHALIDTGALITGMDNREVAEFLMLHLHDDMEGVVYLDRSDRKMVLVRQVDEQLVSSSVAYVQKSVLHFMTKYILQAWISNKDQLHTPL